MPQRNLVGRVGGLIAWVLAATLVFVTWCPLSMRPHLGDANVERFTAFFVTAAAFVLGYPKRPILIGLGAVAAATILEVGQLFIPGRDAAFGDLMTKAVGGLAGAFTSHLLLRLWPVSRKPKTPPRGNVSRRRASASDG
jgi:VanZ family protein